MSKEEWKKSGVEVGHAFKQFGKTFVRSAERVADKATGNESAQQDEDSVFSDGSWRQTGKGLGSAFLGLGSTMIDTVKEAVDSPSPNADTAASDSESEPIDTEAVIVDADKTEE